ncbi:unnamed protein product [Dicrocoelium dendriticum]|nr:unnamed protein product [Dicrocoelium dendriticum]
MYSFFSRILVRPTAVFSASHDSCLSQRLLTYAGFISHSSAGVFVLLPLFNRVLEKFTNLVSSKMTALGAQRLWLPCLGAKEAWETSGRWTALDQLFRLTDRNDKHYCLQPTHEEEITSLLSNFDISYKTLPVLLYQISSKFRDELRPRHGLLRCREFIMKDLYSFDQTPSNALETYNNVCNAYTEILSTLNIPFFKVIADAGHIGGLLSHEFHIPLAVGEDVLCVCERCGTGFNAELKDGLDRIKSESPEYCSHSFKQTKGIEVGHCFLLGQRYSKCFNATYSSQDGPRLFEMGCFGLGLTRLIAASVEHFTTTAFADLPTESITELRWPPAFAPFSGAVALQKESAKDAIPLTELQSLLHVLSLTPEGVPHRPQVHGDVLIDDRTSLSLGRKLLDLRRLGIPWILVAKSRVSSSRHYELIDVYRGRSYEATLEQARVAFQHPDHFDPSFLSEWKRQVS